MNPTRAAMRGRQLANRMMVDHCTITRPGRPAVDTLTGRETQIGVSVYLGPCRVTNAEATGNKVQSAITGTSGRTEVLMLHIPVGAAHVRINDAVTITSDLNPALPGRAFRVVEVSTETFTTTAKYAIEETFLNAG